MPCRLRTLRTDDLQRVMTWRMLPEVTRNMYSDPALTMEDQRAWYERTRQDPSCRYWVIELLPSAQPVGVLSLTNIDLTHRRCDWAYYIGEPSARGIGLGKTLECNICDHVFDQLGLHKLCCEVLASNEKVVALHQRFGSVVEGVRRQHIHKGSEFHDVVLMGLLREEWYALRPTLRYTRMTIE
jgi:UDP-4-amino-4,6-dideoxy-N-acetyl-beta-L-altrosamine N-acetyltransferase